MSFTMLRLFVVSAATALAAGCAVPTESSPAGEETSHSSEALDQGALWVLTHVQNLGDRWTPEGQYAGTKGQSLRLEGFELLTTSPAVSGLGIQYMAHLEGTGDTEWIDAPSFVGTRNQSRRMEGFAIRLTGPQAADYNVLYSCHIQDFGDSIVLNNGQFCGTRGQSRRVEGMTVWIQHK